MKQFFNRKFKITLFSSTLILIGFGIIQYSFGWTFLGDDLYKQTLAGETVPFDKTHQFNIERFDRELAIIRTDESQVQMNWKRAGIFKPLIEKKLNEAGIPLDIFYLAIAESSLRENAISSAGAAGIRQFMPETAKSYGLRVDDYIDERFDTEKETNAAIEYLKKAYNKFGNWTLAMAAFNRGINGITNDMTNQYQNSYYDLRLNTETARYIFRIIAIKEVYKNPSRYFDTSKRGSQYTPPKTIEITANKVENLAVRAAGKGYTYAEIKYLNPRIRKNALPEGSRKIKVYKR